MSDGAAGTQLRVREQAETSYLGFGLLISERSVTVSRDGRTLNVSPCVSTARRFIRAYRRAERQEAKA